MGGDFGTGTIRMLRVLDGILYAVGAFDECDGQPASGVAVRNGNSWAPLGQFNLSSSVLDIVSYNGSIVIIGGFQIGAGNDIAYWNGKEWGLLGPGIVNALSSGQCLTVYQGDLYVGGQIALAPGNPGQNIMRWDGTQFHAVGQGIQQELGNTSSIATVFEMIEHNGLLFIGGGYRAAGGILANGLSTWDGSEWCAVAGDFTTAFGIKAMDFHHDTLFVGTGVVLDGDTVNRAAKFIGGEEYRTFCSGPVSVPEPTRTNEWSLQPNPGEDFLRVLSPERSILSITVKDGSGRTILVEGSHLTEQAIRTTQWSDGIYFVEIISRTGERQVLRWMKQ